MHATTCGASTRIECLRPGRIRSVEPLMRSTHQLRHAWIGAEIVLAGRDQSRRMDVPQARDRGPRAPAPGMPPHSSLDRSRHCAPHRRRSLRICGDERVREPARQRAAKMLSRVAGADQIDARGDALALLRGPARYGTQQRELANIRRCRNANICAIMAPSEWPAMCASSAPIWSSSALEVIGKQRQRIRARHTRVLSHGRAGHSAARGTRSARLAATPSQFSSRAPTPWISTTGGPGPSSR